MRSITSLLVLLSAHRALSAPFSVAETQAGSTISRRFDVDQLLPLITKAFPVNIAVTDLQGAITAPLQNLAVAQNIATAVDADQGACADYTILFARGTFEPGNIGLLVGPAFFQAVQSQAKGKSVSIQGVNYAADVQGFLVGGDPAGSRQLASDVQNALSRCPESKVVMSGYSQGGQLVHKAADILGTVMSKVSSVVIFGDPLNGSPVTGATTKTKVFCNAGDNICEGGALILPPHLTYSLDAGDAAAFVLQQAA